MARLEESMAGQGLKKARKCIELRGVAFREGAREWSGARWCNACGYQVCLHEQILRDDGDPRALVSAVDASKTE
jgi:hypothetical protein